MMKTNHRKTMLKRLFGHELQFVRACFAKPDQPVIEYDGKSTVAEYYEPHDTVRIWNRGVCIASFVCGDNVTLTLNNNVTSIAIFDTNTESSKYSIVIDIV